MGDLLNEPFTAINQSLSLLEIEPVQRREDPSGPDLQVNIFCLTRMIKDDRSLPSALRPRALVRDGRRSRGEVRHGPCAIMILRSYDEILPDC